MDWGYWLPVIFAGLMALSLLLYVVLDGYDLGIGLLLPLVSDEDKDRMIASIGPFWDANETWLVLGIGLLLVAFPAANAMLMASMYLPVALMLGGLILRGVSFDFRVKAKDPHKPWWNLGFTMGSLIAALSQGYMLGRYLSGFAETSAAYGFAVMTAIGLAAAYILLGSAWLILKTEGYLQQQATRWMQIALWPMGFGIFLISVVTPWMIPSIAQKWFQLPNFLLLLPLPLVSICLYFALFKILPALRKQQSIGHDRWCWLPFSAAVSLIVLAFWGLAYSVFPEIVMGKMTIWQAASDTAALKVIFYGAIVVLPVILLYTAFSYRIFRGKISDLRYD